MERKLKTEVKIIISKDQRKKQKQWLLIAKMEHFQFNKMAEKSKVGGMFLEI